MYRGTLLTLALNIHHAETGQWPARLDDIKAVSIKEFRTDLYSVKDFVYKLKNGKPLLYCVGVDGKDNGGETHDGHFGEKIKNSDYIFFPMPPKP